MVEELEDEGIKVIQSTLYGTTTAAVEECLQEHFQDSPEVLKYCCQIHHMMLGANRFPTLLRNCTIGAMPAATERLC